MGKFDSELSERLYGAAGHGMADQETGSVDELGWYCRFDEERAILRADSQGLVSVTQYENDVELEAAWFEIELAQATIDDEEGEL